MIASERSSDGGLHLGSKRSGEHRVKVELGTVDFAGLLLKFRSPTTEEDWSIRLRAVMECKVSESWFGTKP